MLTVVNSGKVSQISAIRDHVLSGAELHLFTNNKTPAPDDTPSDYTEPSFTGYNPINLSSWGNVFINGDGKAQMDEILREFTFGGGSPEYIYGYFVTTAGGVLQFAEPRSGGPVLLDTIGQVYSVVPTYTGDNEEP